MSSFTIFQQGTTTHPKNHGQNDQMTIVIPQLYPSDLEIPEPGPSHPRSFKMGFSLDGNRRTASCHKRSAILSSRRGMQQKSSIPDLIFAEIMMSTRLESIQNGLNHQTSSQITNNLPEKTLSNSNIFQSVSLAVVCFTIRKKKNICFTF